MRFSFYSLRTGILAYLSILIISAMLLINVVMVKFAEKDLVDSRVKTGQLLLRALGQMLGHEITDKRRSWGALRSDGTFMEAFTPLLTSGGFSHLVIVSHDGRKVLSRGPWEDKEMDALSLAREVLVTRKDAHDFYGTSWGVIWLAHEKLILSHPILFRGELLGAVTVCTDLSPLYKGLRQSERMILLYIVLNTIILVLFGFHLLSRIVVKPVYDLLQVTQRLEGGEAAPALADSSQNEIGQLSRSLHLMLRRLDENKKDLQTHIASLEEANRELKQAQDEIIRSEKLASVGRLATGVAHEIGNPIGIVLGYLELLNAGDLNEEERRDFLARIESEITRVNQIIRQLLDFSRHSSGEPRATRVHPLLTETIQMLRPQPMMSHIRIRSDLRSDRDTVLADPDQLKQVFVNIIMNAADAMTGLEHHGRNDTSHTLSILTEEKQGRLEITFHDTGPGIPEPELARIFDPFYSTKEPGRGTGLGLSVCYRIVEALGGTLRAESKGGAGATIIVDIPLHAMNNGQDL